MPVEIDIEIELIFHLGNINRDRYLCKYVPGIPQAPRRYEGEYP